ncbi:hypothetical protein [Paraburkholderia sp. BCC1876]|uniref:hypothetical protein n=1 Tax=Paraburkholderia sp. BCC1876 TaxID=2676303 RepID=UPI0015923711|nr:hypothetical protein [Paraburkholderia sp. BCC1876]
MQHTVIGLFDTYSQAEGARDTLVQTGFARETIELQANPEPSVGSATDEVASTGVIANIERFLSSLFATGARAPDTARYAEAVRRGAVLVCVNAVSEAHADLARETLTRLGAVDIGERVPEWNEDAAPGREHSVLDELGIGTVRSGTPRSSSVAASGVMGADAPAAGVATPSASPTMADPLYAMPPGNIDAEPFVPPPLSERPVLDPVNEPVTDPLVGDAGRSAIAAGSIGGSGAIMQPSEVVPEATHPTSGLGAQIPNEYLEYEEDFRSHYDEQYAAENSRYEDYVPAYRYGAEIGQDARFRDMPWDDVEPEVRRQWETTAPDSAWERFKLAVRHGWERVTGHHHV